MEMREKLLENVLFFENPTPVINESLLEFLKGFSSIKESDLSILTEDEKQDKAKKLMDEAKKFLEDNKKKAKTYRVISIATAMIVVGINIIALTNPALLIIGFVATIINLISFVLLGISLLSSAQLAKIVKKAAELDNRLARSKYEDKDEIKKLRNQLKKILKHKK